MKIAIIYGSIHHKNTKKVVEAMSEEREISLFSLEQAKNLDFSEYNYIGFASGIYMNTMHLGILKFMNEVPLSSKQKIFLVYTCGAHYRDYAKKAKQILKNKESMYVGCFWCRGYDTYGFLNKIGGIAKDHPNLKDLTNAKKFISKLA